MALNEYSALEWLLCLVRLTAACLPLTFQSLLAQPLFWICFLFRHPGGLGWDLAGVNGRTSPAVPYYYVPPL